MAQAPVLGLPGGACARPPSLQWGLPSPRGEARRSGATGGGKWGWTEMADTGDEDRGEEQRQDEGERPVGGEEVRRGGRGVGQRGAEELGRRLGAEAQRPCRKGSAGDIERNGGWAS